jgi:phosphoglycerate dehydrogenase-like enzyme
MSNATAVLSRSFSRHPQLRQEMTDRYGEVRFNTGDKTLAGADLIAFLTGARRAIVAMERIDDATLAALPDLEIISKYGVGCDNIDLEACARHGVKVGWTGGVNRLAVAELALSFMIASLRRVGEGLRQVAVDGGWTQLLGRQLTGRTVGVIGFGAVGSEVARLLAPFHCRILATDIRDREDVARVLGVAMTPLDALLSQAEIVTLHVPLTEKTRHMIGAEALARMRPDAIVVNTARGGIIDEAALADALASGRLAAAAIDVLEKEPPVDRRLIGLRNVIVTPHIGGSSEEAVLAMGRAAMDGLESAKDPLYVLV